MQVDRNSFRALQTENLLLWKVEYSVVAGSEHWPYPASRTHVHPFVRQMLPLNGLSVKKQKRCEVILTLSLLLFFSFFREAIDIGQQTTHGQ